MLLNYSFQNFKSYRDAQQFSMLRSKSAQNRDAAPWKRRDVSVVSGIYGGNASGKSACLDSLRFAAKFITKGFGGSVDLSKGLHPFMLDAGSRNRPSRFLIEFIGPMDGHYQYEFDVTKERVLYEELRKYHGARSSRVFLREFAEEEHGYHYSYGRDFRGNRKLYESITRPDVLMLSALHAANCLPAEEAYLEFSERFGYFDATGYEQELPLVRKELSERTAMGRALQAVMASSGLGINVIEAKDALDLLYEANALKDDARAGEYRKLASGLVALSRPDLSPEEREKVVDGLMSKRPEAHSKLVFSHAGRNGYVGELFEEDESRGTRAALAFFSMALRRLSARSVVIVDEIDTSLHPLYVEELVRLFLDPRTNPEQSQLIFTTHDVSLISRSMEGQTTLDRDQIWFAEKNASGESTLYPLSEIKSRSGENFGKNYLNGIYGAAPQPSFHQSFASAVALVSESSDAFKVSHGEVAC